MSAAKVTAYISGILAVVYIVKRDIQRRKAGITRRSPAEVLADIASARLSRFPGKLLSNFILRHRTVTYILGVIVLFLLFKYQQFLRRWLVSNKYNHECACLARL